MKWLTRLRTYLGHDEHVVSTVEQDNRSAKEAAEAFAKAQKALAEARTINQESKQVASVLNGMDRRNHYGEGIFQAMLPKEKHS